MDYYELDEIDTPQVMTLEEAAAVLQISDQTMQRIIATGVLNIQDRTISREDLLDYLIDQEAVNLPVEAMSQNSGDDENETEGTVEKPSRRVEREPSLFDFDL